MQVEKALLSDFDVRLGHGCLTPMADHKKPDMVVWKRHEIRIDAKQLGFALNGNAGFFHQLAAQSEFHRFVFLDASTRKMPAGAISVADEQDTVALIDYDALRAEREPARDAPVALEDP